jgi:hypothetical protein
MYARVRTNPCGRWHDYCADQRQGTRVSRTEAIEDESLIRLIKIIKINKRYKQIGSPATEHSVAGSFLRWAGTGGYAATALVGLGKFSD